MSVIAFEQFGGAAPMIAPSQLADGYAQKALNTRLDRGRLEPYQTMLEIGKSAAGRKTIFLYEDTYWFVDNDVVSFVPSPIVNDPYKYVFIADTDYPRVTRNDLALAGEPYPTTSYRLSVPSPSLAPNISVQGATPAEADPLDAETVSYVYTYVNAWGWESVPSLPSNSVDVYFPDQSVDLSLTIPSGGNSNMGSGAKIRIYRSNAGTESGAYQLCAEILASQNSHSDSLESDELGSVLASAEWDGPPDDDTSLYPDGPLFWMGAAANGYLIGVTKTEICFSEINVPYAWPIAYRKPIKDIVGCAITDNGAVVLTKDIPYLVYGSDPSSMSLAPLNYQQPCVSKRSIVSGENIVMYASPDGLCGIANGELKVLTEGIFSQDEWTELNPDTIWGIYHEGKYFGFCEANSGDRGFILDPRGGSVSWVDLGFYAECGHRNNDTLYLNQTNGQIAKFNKGTNTLSYEWVSKRVQMDQALNFALLKVKAKRYPAQVTVYAYYDDQLVNSTDFTVNDSRPVYMESGFLANEWEVKIHGDGQVTGVYLASDWSEL